MKMAGRRLVVGIALALVTAVSAGARAAEIDQQCSVGGRYHVRSVGAYTTYVDAGYTSYTQFQGAEMFVPAQPGLTGEWLQRVLADQIATGACDFGVRNAKVSVLSSGGGFSVRVSGQNEKDAGVILQHAELLTR
jgi:hypothetical protein